MSKTAALRAQQRESIRCCRRRWWMYLGVCCTAGAFALSETTLKHVGRLFDIDVPDRRRSAGIYTLGFEPPRESPRLVSLAMDALTRLRNRLMLTSSPCATTLPSSRVGARRTPC